MLFKRSFGLTRSLFILYVHEHDRLGFGMWKQLYLIAYVPVATGKVSVIRSNIIWNRWKSTLRARSIRVNLNQGEYLARNLKADVNILVL